MFGYIRPRRDSLRMRDYDRYRAAYCGLCHALGHRCGFAARFLVSYDMTFLYVLLQSSQGCGRLRQCRCPARVKRRSCEVDSPVMDQTADLSVLLYYWKLRDETADSRGLRRVGARLAAVMLKGAYRKAAQAQPEADATIRSQLQRLAELEARQTDSLDAPADAFAKILQSFAAGHPEERAAGQLLYHVGRYIYLVDALDDLAEDCAQDRYNPLRYRFSVENGQLAPADQSYFLSTIHGSIGMACGALELMTKRSGDELLNNIVYEGMPTVLNLVAAGRFETKGKL